ncbi:MAG: response regulator [Anaerolineales bacterium]|nr:response regulator [Anaerolineales bacterium]MCB0010913.1 response regulator [Anaerolineales bacterium]MCB0018403.1 response regulator [Anaerolineales bacterium]MCB0029890.1 response regulator [Anaerolineales bacterium]
MMKTILVVDDSPVIRRMLNLTLKKAGYVVLLAADGEIAQQFLLEMPVDLLLIDINMPRMDGLTLLRCVRAEEAWQALPVIMLTSSGEELDRQAAVAAGANSFLNKPAGARELLDTINKLMTRQEAP